MNYPAIYEALIERARRRHLVGYVERHHVCPRCLGGGDEAENIVELTAEEHYLAHQLLVRIHPGNPKLIWAAIAMTEGGRTQGRAGNKLYGWLRRCFAENQRGRQYTAETKAKIGAASRLRNQGKDHPMYGRVHSAETRQRLSQALLGVGKGRRRGPPSAETRRKLSDAQKKHQESHVNPFSGKQHTEATKAKMKAAWERKRVAASSLAQCP